MTGPEITPEDGVTGYEHDRTQGPACAIAAGAATIYRNYSMPFGSEMGQTRERQLNLFIDLGFALSKALRVPVTTLWNVRNGYLLIERTSLETINKYLRDLDCSDYDRLRDLIKIGLHWDVEVTDVITKPAHLVHQAFCSALPLAYNPHPIELWEPLARLVLEASYEATLLAAVLNQHRGGSNAVFLTSLGGGAFGNPRSWIHDALSYAVKRVPCEKLNLNLVSFTRRL
jgi:hypothetical protein